MRVAIQIGKGKCLSCLTGWWTITNDAKHGERYRPYNSSIVTAYPL